MRKDILQIPRHQKNLRQLLSDARRMSLSSICRLVNSFIATDETHQPADSGCLARAIRSHCSPIFRWNATPQILVTTAEYGRVSRTQLQVALFALDGPSFLFVFDVCGVA